VDLQEAYRHIRVHPLDWPLLGMRFEGKVYVDTFLPFGASSSPEIFNTLADALAWIAGWYLPPSTRFIHYLDDFLFISPSQALAEESLHAFRALCKRLGVKIKEEKTIGPTQAVPFLGLTIDAERICISVPAKKMHDTLTELQHWLNRDRCSRRELESLIGSLTFVAKAIHLARSFLRCMIACLRAAKQNRIVLSEGFRQDVRWWLRFSQHWNGTQSFLPLQPVSADKLQLFTDASGHWFQLEFPPSPTPSLLISVADSIAAKELLAVVLAAFTWVGLLAGTYVTFRIDNLSAVSAVNSETVERHQDDATHPSAAIRSLCLPLRT
jgi:hypothetical protein